MGTSVVIERTRLEVPQHVQLAGFRGEDDAVDAVQRPSRTGGTGEGGGAGEAAAVDARGEENIPRAVRFVTHEPRDRTRAESRRERRVLCIALASS
jgi:hypothetical protein